MAMHISEDSKDPRFTAHMEKVNEFNKEFEALMDKYEFKGIVLGVTSGDKTEDGVACAAFANGHMRDATSEQKRAMVTIIDRCTEDLFEKIKFSSMMDMLANKLGIDKEKCDCKNCTGPEEVNLDDSTAGEDTSEPKQEPEEEDPRSVLDRENGEAAEKYRE